MHFSVCTQHNVCVFLFLLYVSTQSYVHIQRKRKWFHRKKGTQPIFQAKSLSLGLKIKYQNSNRIGAMLLLRSFSFDMNQIKVRVDLVETNMAQK